MPEIERKIKFLMYQVDNLWRKLEALDQEPQQGVMLQTAKP